MFNAVDGNRGSSFLIRNNLDNDFEYQKLKQILNIKNSFEGFKGAFPGLVEVKSRYWNRRMIIIHFLSDNNLLNPDYIDNIIYNDGVEQV